MLLPLRQQILDAAAARRYCKTMNGSPDSSPVSKIVTLCAWSPPAAKYYSETRWENRAGGRDLPSVAVPASTFKLRLQSPVGAAFLVTRARPEFGA